MSKKWFYLSLPLLLLLTACGISLASDITPPPTYKSPTPPKSATAAVSQAALPLLPPDPVQGAAAYMEKCLPCHGTTGRGDGPQAAKLGLPVPAIGTLELARKAKPADWYNLVTVGRMEKGMPPFRSLNDRQRWDVVAYTYTLSTTPAALAQGKALYVEKCAECHGAGGKGDGAKAAAAKLKMPDWTEPGRLAQRSATDLLNVTKNGTAAGMPAFASQLNDEQGWALADYLRTLSFASATGASQTAAATSPAAAAAGTPQAAPSATPAVAATPVAQGTPAPFSVVVAGKINTAGGVTLPAGLKVTLQGFDAMSVGWEATVDVKADGSYRFENVEVQPGRTFLASTEYQKVPYESEPLHAADLKAGQEAALPITLAEVTSDAKTLSVQRMHVFFDFTQPGMVQVAELFIINNSGSQAVAPASPDKPVLLFELPAGATELSFQEGDLGARYVKTEKGFGDLSPVLPNGQLQVLFGYVMPYAGKATIAIPLLLPVESSVLMVPADGIKVESSQLRSAGERAVDGVNIQLFTANSLPANSKLEVTISGEPTVSTVPAGATGGTAATNPRDLVIGIGAFGLVLVVAGIWLYRQRRNEAEDEAAEDDETESEEEEDVEAAAEGEEDAVEDTPEALLDAIVALDDLYQAGQLPEAAYQQRRADLKARLKAVRGK